MHATTEGAEILRSGKRPAPPRHRSRLLPQTERRLAQAPPTPFIDGSKSVASCAHANNASIGVTGYPRSGNSLTATQILTATLTFAVTCGRSCVPLAVEPEVSPLECQWVPQAGPSRGPRCRHRAHGTPAAHRRRRFAHRSGHSRFTAPAVLSPYGASGLATRVVPQASCRTVPSAQADGSKPASGPRHGRGPLPSPIRPSTRPLPIHSTRCASYTGLAGIGPRDGTVSLS